MMMIPIKLSLMIEFLVRYRCLAEVFVLHMSSSGCTTSSGVTDNGHYLLTESIYRTDKSIRVAFLEP